VNEYHGDHFGRIFAHWVAVYFGQFRGNRNSSANLCDTFVHGSNCALIWTKNWLGYLLGDFSQTHLVTLTNIRITNLHRFIFVRMESIHPFHKKWADMHQPRGVVCLLLGLKIFLYIVGMYLCICNHHK
jgi:hypothetical protein